MQTKCAWCNNNLENLSKDNKLNPVENLCSTCQKLLDMYDIPMNSLINTYSMPIVFLNEKNEVVESNHAAHNLLKNFKLDTNSTRIGNVLQCKNATLPQGCGKTPECSSCKINRAIRKTFESNINITNQEVSILQNTDSEELIKIPLLISTQKSGSGIIIRFKQI